MNLSAEIIKKLAIKSGFDICGITRPHRAKLAMDAFDKWIDSGSAADMAWVNNNKELRLDPCNLFEGCKSIIVLGLSYHRHNSPDNISMLAGGVDYHFVMKDMLKELHHQIEKESGVEMQCKLCVDSAPIFEKYWAEQAGLGWIGRNSLLINPEFGSFIVLGELLIDAEVDKYDSKIDFNGCGRCQRCLVNCPSGALSENRVDARCCISYLTIEHKGEFNEDQKEILKSPLGAKSYFGCEICQRVCPWNKKAAKHLTELKNKKVVNRFKSDDFIFDMEYFKQLNSASFKKSYRSTALYRCSFKNILRNIEVVI